MKYSFNIRTKETKAWIANLCLVVMELIGLSFSISSRFYRVFAYYTQISNMLTLIGSVSFLIRPKSKWTSALRFMNTVMLTLTMLITVCVLIPMGADAGQMLLGKSQVFHHVLCPILSLISYCCFENNEHEPLLLPGIMTLIYGIPMLILNGLEVYKGPYPFLRINQQGIPVTILWVIGILLLVYGIGLGIKKIRERIQKRSNA